MEKAFIKKDIFLIFCMSFICLFAGCGDTDSILNEDGPTNEITMPVIEENKGEEHIIDSVSYVNDDGVTVEVEIDIDKEKIAVEESTIIYYNDFLFDAESKEKVVKAIFGDANVYSADEEDYTISMIDKMIEIYEVYSSENESEDGSEVDFYDIKITELKGLKDNAPNEPKPVTDYDHEAFYGYIDGCSQEILVRFELYNQEDIEHRFSSIFIGYSSMAPYYEFSKEKPVEILAKCDSEKKYESVRNVLIDSEIISEKLFDDSKNVNAFEESVRLSSPTETYFSLGCSLSNIGSSEYNYDEIHSVVVAFDGDNIAKMIVENPIKITDEEKVDLLPFDEILSVVKEKIVLGDLPGISKIRNVDLIIKSISSDDGKMLVPAWDFGCIVLNAVDGTVLDS